MADGFRPHIVAKEAEVRDLATGRLVDRPDVAEVAYVAVAEAIEAAGGTLSQDEGFGLRLVQDEEGA